jgi:crotonobetainyl-CoA:carnitine CoA-transferase CaiB-like acyl-CoA transferase
MKFLREGAAELQQLNWLASEFAVLSGFTVDPQELLAQRVRHTGWQAGPSQSVGGSCHLMLTSDKQWVAINLARPEDHELLAIFFPTISRRENQIDISQVRHEVRRCTASVLIDYAIEVGLPISRLGEVTNKYSVCELPIAIQQFEKPIDQKLRSQLRVVDLSSLWAGPLCSHLLHRCGYSVTKVESQQRPDGARFGNPKFFAELDAGKNHVEIDFSSNDGINQLHEMIRNADVVIEGSRPRALQQLGIDAEQILSEARPRMWLSMTGYGREGSAGQRVGFGDDCAVAGGLVDHSPSGPQFVGDAVADPITGLVAATAILRAVNEQKSCLIGVSLAETASWLNSVRGNRESQQD